MQHEAPATRLIRAATVIERTGQPRSTLYRNIGAGLMPPPVKLPGGGSSAWIEAEIDAVVTAVVRGIGGNELRSLVTALVEARTAGEVAA